MTCKDDCLHYEACKSMIESFGYAVKEREQDGLNADTHCKQFEEKDLYIKLPCKVGDKLYSVCSDTIVEYNVRRFSFQRTQQCSDLRIYVHTQWGMFNAKQIGKSVFLTREEAEKAVDRK